MDLVAVPPAFQWQPVGTIQSVSDFLGRCRLVIDAVLGTGRSRPLEGAVKEAMDMLAGAERPIIFAGGGVFFSGGAGELERLVDITNIPFYMAPMSRGLVPEDHPVSFQGARSTAMREADVVLVAATRL